MSGKIRRQLDKSLLFIEKNLDEKITVEQVAQSAFMSKFHFQRLFSAYLGETVSQYILHRRLERAAETLVNKKGLTITEIAKRAGFETGSTFSRAFKKHFNISPSNFRQASDFSVFSENQSNPFLKTSSAKTAPIDITIVERPVLWFNHKLATVPYYEEAFIEKNVMLIAADMMSFLDEGRPHLFGTATSRTSGQADRVATLDDLLYGAIYKKKHDDAWSDNWFEIEAGLWAVAIYKGNYKYSYQSWNRLIRSWLIDSAYELRESISFERYLNQPWLMENPDDWLTQIHLPIKKSKT